MSNQLLLSREVSERGSECAPYYLRMRLGASAPPIDQCCAAFALAGISLNWIGVVRTTSNGRVLLVLTEPCARSAVEAAIEELGDAREVCFLPLGEQSPHSIDVALRLARFDRSLGSA